MDMNYESSVRLRLEFNLKSPQICTNTT